MLIKPVAGIRLVHHFPDRHYLVVFVTRLALAASTPWLSFAAKENGVVTNALNTMFCETD